MTTVAVGPVFVGDLGHNFDVLLEYRDEDPDSPTYGQILPFDLSAGGPLGAPSSLEYVFDAPPGHTRITRTPTIISATAGTLRWTNDAITDFTVPGRWRLQVQITFLSGEVVRTAIGYFNVGEAL